jgi:hypothetical protein
MIFYYSDLYVSTVVYVQVSKILEVIVDTKEVHIRSNTLYKLYVAVACREQGTSPVQSTVVRSRQKQSIV